MTKLFALAAFAAIPALLSAPAAAEVESQSDVGFAIKHKAQVAASPDAVWTLLSAPNRWWDGRHSFTGDAANFFLDMQAGGCFCERIRMKKGDKLENGGSVQHMQVVYVEPPKVLRMTGALGPLQSEGVNGTLTIGLKPSEGGTLVTFEYVVGGYMRYETAEIAPAVDGVIGQQLSRLAKLVEGGDAAAPTKAEPMPEAKPPAADKTATKDDSAGD